MKKITLLTLSTFASFALLGCGGSSSSTPSNTNTGTGYYVDNAVAGVDYVCGTQRGKTDKEGKFTFEEGKECKFSVAGIPLRTTSADKLTDGGKILENNLKVATFLQSIDADGNLSNGIEIDDKVLTALTDALANIDDDTTILSNDTVLTTVVAEVGSQVEGVSGTVRTENEVQEHLAQTQTEITKELLAGKTFYAAYNENGVNTIEKHIVNADATSSKWEQVFGQNNKGTTSISISRDIVTFTNDNNEKITLKILSNTSKYLEIKYMRDGEIEKLYFSLEDAKKALESSDANGGNDSSASGDLAKLLAGKTMYKPDNHDGEKTITTFVFNQNMTKMTANETYTFDITTTNDRFTFNFESKKRIYKMVGNNSDYLDMNYLEDKTDRIKEQYRFYFDKSKAQSFLDTL